MWSSELKSVMEQTGNRNVSQNRVFPQKTPVFKSSVVIRSPGFIVRGEKAELGPQCCRPWLLWFSGRVAGEQWASALVRVLRPLPAAAGRSLSCRFQGLRFWAPKRELKDGKC